MESPLGQKGTRGCNRIGNITAIYGVVAVSFLIYFFFKIRSYLFVSGLDVSYDRNPSMVVPVPINDHL